jgi:hypothetical protein
MKLQRSQPNSPTLTGFRAFACAIAEFTLFPERIYYTRCEDLQKRLNRAGGRSPETEAVMKMPIPVASEIAVGSPWRLRFRHMAAILPLFQVPKSAQ